jgi:microcystin degradation protein MlrC
MSKKRILMCGLAQESNSFNPVPMTMKSFHPVSMEVSGYDNSRAAREYLADKDVEMIWGISMRSASGAPLANEVVDYFMNDTMERIKSAGKLDGVLLMLHGATMSESCDDICGYICVGEGLRICAFGGDPGRAEEVL